MAGAVLSYLLLLSLTNGAVGESPRHPQRFPVPVPDPIHPEKISFKKFNNYEQISNYLMYLAGTRPEKVRVTSLGPSSEGRPILAIRISDDVRTAASKPVILIDAGIHAREWAAPAVALYLIHQLAERGEFHEGLLKTWDWHIVPCLNPDGYEFSMKVDRMWRKNRSNTTDPNCQGVDLNRNFDIFFGGLGTSKDPCDETFTGRGPFSEPETRALRDLALKLKPRTRLYMTLHSYGQSFLYPWGFGDVLPRDWKDLDRLARVAEKALASVRGNHYEIGSSTQLLGPAAGGSDDWMKARGGAKYSYTIELPGGGHEGFDLPEEQILDMAVEMFAAIRKAAQVAADEIKDQPRMKPLFTPARL